MNKIIKNALLAIGASVLMTGCVAVVEPRGAIVTHNPVHTTAYVSYSYPYYYDRPYYYISGVYYYGGYYQNGYYYYNGRKLRGGHYYHNRYRYYNGRRYKAVNGRYGYYTDRSHYRKSRHYRKQSPTRYRTRDVNRDRVRRDSEYTR